MAGIAIGQPQDIGRGRDAAFDRIGHFAKTHQIHVRHGEAHRRYARAGDKAGAKTGFFDQPGAHAIAAARHHLKPRFVEKHLQRGSLWTHRSSLFAELVRLKLSLEVAEFAGVR